MIYLTNEEIQKKISVKDGYNFANDVIKNKKETILPAKTSLKLEGHIFYNYMPCIIPKYNIAGVKIVNRYPQNNPSLKSNILVYDLASGDLKAILDGEYITTLRTGAVAAHSILTFARKNFETIALVGLGNVTTMAFRVLLEKIGDRQLRVKLLKFQNDAEEFVEKFKEYANCTFEIVDNNYDLMHDSDVIVSGVTYADSDFTDVENYKKGCTIIPIHTLGFQNCDRVFDKVFGDDYDHIKGFKYFNEFKNFNEVCDVINGKVKGRENDEERILVYNIGIAIHDLYFANKVLEK